MGTTSSLKHQSASTLTSLSTSSLTQQPPPNQHIKMPVWAAVPIIAGVVAKGLQVGLDAWESRDLGDKGFEIVARVAEFNVEDRQSSCFSNVKEGVPQHIVDSC